MPTSTYHNKFLVCLVLLVSQLGCQALDLFNDLEDSLVNNELDEATPMQISIEARFLVVEEKFLEEQGVNIELLADVQGDGSSDSLGDTHDGGFSVSGSGLQLGGHVQSTYIYQEDLPPFLLPGMDADKSLDDDVLVFPEYKHTSNKTESYDDPLITGYKEAPQTLLTGSSVSADEQAQLVELHGALLDDVDLELLLKAAESANEQQIDAPETLLLNGQRGLFAISSEPAAPEDAWSDFQEQIDQFGSQVSTITAGPVLDIEPIVQDDGTIQMNIYPGTQLIHFGLPTLITIQGAQQQVYVPVVGQSFQLSTISVPDGGTLLLGGQRLAGQEVQSGLPALSDLPLLNRPFKDQAVVPDDRSLLVLVTARILQEQEQDEP